MNTLSPSSYEVTTVPSSSPHTPCSSPYYKKHTAVQDSIVLTTCSWHQWGTQVHTMNRYPEQNSRASSEVGFPLCVLHTQQKLLPDFWELLMIQDQGMWGIWEYFLTIATRRACMHAVCILICLHHWWWLGWHLHWAGLSVSQYYPALLQCGEECCHPEKENGFNNKHFSKYYNISQIMQYYRITVVTSNIVKYKLPVASGRFSFLVVANHFCRGHVT